MQIYKKCLFEPNLLKEIEKNTFVRNLLIFEIGPFQFYYHDSFQTKN